MKVTSDQRASWLQNTAESPFNQWLNAQVKASDGTFDVGRLYEVARRYGVEREENYAHLNPGQQRMVIGNILRRIVPPDEYKLGLAAVPMANDQGHRNQRPAHIRTASVRELLIMHSEIMDELREREIVRTANAPLGDYAEMLFAAAFGWSLESNSSKGHDATDEAGVRYQIKSRRVTSRNRSRQLSAIRRLPDQTFDFLAGILFDDNYRVSKAILIPHMVVLARAKRVEHTNSWRFMLEDHVWHVNGTRDVTQELTSTAEKL